MLKIFKAFVLVLFLGFSANVAAHEVRPAYLQISETGNNIYKVFWKVPTIRNAEPDIKPIFPKGYTLEMLRTPQTRGNGMVYAYVLKGNESLAGKQITIEGLSSSGIDALINIEYANGEKASLLVQPGKNSGIIPGKTDKGQVVKTYTILGVEHILFGLDHLLFVLALIIITKGFKKVLKTITAFTLAHSITLSMAVLGYANVPGPPVEAIIALSIVFLAVEILKNINGEQTLTSKKPWLVAFTFGLLHGFGFAGALAEVGLPQSEIPLALAFFNVGVELGQIGFVILALILIKILALNKNWPMALKKLPAYAIGSIAMFWMIERITGFWN